jgi:hypothetical protein
MRCTHVKKGVCTCYIIFFDEDASASFTVYMCEGGFPSQLIL